MGSLQTLRSIALDKINSRPQDTSYITIKSWKHERKNEVRRSDEISME